MAKHLADPMKNGYVPYNEFQQPTVEMRMKSLIEKFDREDGTAAERNKIKQDFSHIDSVESVQQVKTSGTRVRPRMN